jgi:hypothetical protein
MAETSAMSTEPTAQTKPKPKGILKKPSAPPTTEPPTSSSSPPQEPVSSTPLTRAELLAQQETAARLRLLQKLRETELKPPVPLETFELLSQLPRSPFPPHDASNPSPADTTLFLTSLRDFQPREYLDLIEERNCLGKCGYTLCPKPRRTHAGPFKISSRSGSIAKTADLNKWCSDACALRALYLKVQLDNPTYERTAAGGRMVVKLELRDEKTGKDRSGSSTKAGTGAFEPRGSKEDRDELAKAMAQLEIDRHKKARKEASALAGERGDPGGSLAGLSRVDVTIKESAADGPVEPPSNLGKGAEFMVEGYMPKYINPGAGKKPDEGGESDDEDDEFFTVRL